MKRIAVLLSLILFLSCCFHTIYAQDSVITRDLIELESLIDKEPPFYFRNDINSKSLLKQELKQMILLADEDNLQETKNLTDLLLFRIEEFISDPIFKEVFRKKLIDVLIKIKEINQN